jgi:hypothetical protein
VKPEQYPDAADDEQKNTSEEVFCFQLTDASRRIDSRVNVPVEVAQKNQRRRAAPFTRMFTSQACDERCRGAAIIAAVNALIWRHRECTSDHCAKR